ncbi:class C sortase [Lactobacillus sp. CC-MHH1034]|uniref:class C sortase n=1 Tax=Agrilactobacillus fermenti TaxID=2586909 RepID=UPI001E57A27D|nr:class C sortase [Agrilactobacillus fermenti]MCD2256506.1 class C sortase [Agrilactobacillus fermenti]
MVKGKHRRRKRRFTFFDALMLLLLLIGLGGLIYPFFRDAVNRSINQQLVQYYQRKSDRAHDAKMAMKRRTAQKENQKLAEKNATPQADPFSTTNKSVPQQKKLSYYERHTVGTLHIPKLNTSMPIFDMTTDLLLQQGAGILTGTSQLTGGVNTHTVISAHRGLLNAKLFTDLPKLKKKDRFYIHANDRRLAYEVRKIKVIKPTEHQYLRIEHGRDKVTLMTCTPYMINSHRLLVTGYRIPYPQTKASTQIKEIDQDQEVGALRLVAIIIVLLLVAIVLWAIYCRGRRLQLQSKIQPFEFRSWRRI